MLIAIGDLYALAGAATFAISSAMIKRLHNVGNVTQLNFLRTLIGAIIFPIHLLIIREFHLLFTLSPLISTFLALSVIFNVVLGDSAFFESQNRLGVKIATPLVNTYPYFTILFAVLLLNEAVTSNLIIGSLLLVPGAVLLSIDKASGVTVQDKIKKENRIIGLALIFFAVACYTAGILFTTVATRTIGPVLANSIRLPVGMVGLFTLASYVDTRSNRMLSEDNKTGWNLFIQYIKETTLFEKFLLLITGIFGTYLSSLFLVLSVQSIGASRSSILFSTGPFFALPIAVFWLKEEVGLKTLLGTILTVAGLWVILN